MRKLSAIVLTAALGLSCLCACSSGSAASPAATTAAAAETKAEAAATEAAATEAAAAGAEAVTEAAAASSGEKKTIGMVVKNTTTEYIQAFMIGAQEKCDEYGIELRIVDGQADSLKIMDAIDTFIVQGIDGFILAGAEDLVTLVPGIERLNEEGIPVFAADTCPEGGKVEMFITNDIVDSSRKAAQQMVDGIKEANGGEVPEGVIIEITGALVDMYTTDCHAGFESVLKDYPQLTVVQGEGNWNNDDSFARASDLLTRYGDDVKGIYVHTPDIMGSGVVSACEAAGLDPKDYFISGICIGAEGMSLLKEGKLYAVVEQPALDMIHMIIDYMNMEFNGEAIPKEGDTIEEDGALWSPAKVINNEYCDEGLTMILQSPLVPQECDPDDKRLYENVIAQ
ncbi:MAG: sugar ABC transporter substrate-binding protein [Eubacteriales bacterium]|nr:sugar ABC transporter substrate-binding protein [Eubacteriales bacterium]